jgi:hypothetical protein
LQSGEPWRLEIARRFEGADQTFARRDNRPDLKPLGRVLAIGGIRWAALASAMTAIRKTPMTRGAAEKTSMALSRRSRELHYGGSDAARTTQNNGVMLWSARKNSFSARFSRLYAPLGCRTGRLREWKSDRMPLAHGARDAALRSIRKAIDDIDTRSLAGRPG